MVLLNLKTTDCDSLQLVKLRSHRSQSYNNRWIHPTFIKQPRQSFHPCFSIFSLSFYMARFRQFNYLHLLQQAWPINLNWDEVFNLLNSTVYSGWNQLTHHKQPFESDGWLFCGGVVCSIESTNMDCYN